MRYSLYVLLHLHTSELVCTRSHVCAFLCVTCFHLCLQAASSESSSSDDDDEDDDSDDSDSSSDNKRKGKDKARADKEKEKARADKEREKEKARAEKEKEKEKVLQKEKERKEKESQKAKSKSKADKDKDRSGRADSSSLIDLGGDNSPASLLDLPTSTPPQSSTSIAVTLPLEALPASAQTPQTPTKEGTSLSLQRGTSFLEASKLTQHTLLHFTNGGGLGVTHIFSREGSIYSPHMTSIRLGLKNTTNQPLVCVRVGAQKLESGMEMQPFNEVCVCARVRVS